MSHPETDATGRSALWCAAVGLVAAVAFVLLADQAFATGSVRGEQLQTVLAYGATWVPMLAAIGVFVLMRGGRDAGGERGAVLGIRLRWIDLLWGAAIGVLGRFVATGMSLALYGTTGLVGQPTIGAVDGWYVFGALIAPVLISPLIEEGFFRGLMQGALVRRFGGVAGVAVTVLVFTGVHLIGVPAGTQAVATGIPLLVFAAAAGVSRMLTGRIGAAVVGHVVFNGIAVLFTWPW